MNRNRMPALLAYVCLLFFLLVQAMVSLRIILELLALVPGAFWGLSGGLIVFSAAICLMVKVLLSISRLIDETVTESIWKYRMAVGSVVCFGIIYPAALGFQDGMTALFYYKAMNLQILLPWVISSTVVLAGSNLGSK